MLRRSELSRRGCIWNSQATTTWHGKSPPNPCSQWQFPPRRVGAPESKGPAQPGNPTLKWNTIRVEETRLDSQAGISFHSTAKLVTESEHQHVQGCAGWDTVAKNDGGEAREPGLLSEEVRGVFGKNCRDARLEKGLSNQEVAPASGIAQPRIAKLELEKIQVPVEP